MERIYFEKQEGSLCGKHAINALLQDEIFSAMHLADIARNLDAQEKEMVMNSPDVLNALQKESQNVDDSGYFSLQVLEAALSTYSLQLHGFSSERAINAQIQPTQQKAFICNFERHWFTIRKIGTQWFNLNSILTGPDLLSDTYLEMFLTQLHKEGKNIFVVEGQLPECELDNILTASPVDPAKVRKPQPPSAQFRLSLDGASGQGTSTDVDPAVAAFIAESKADAEANDVFFQNAMIESRAAKEDEDFQKALAMSMQEVSGPAGDVPSTSSSVARESTSRAKGRSQPPSGSIEQATGTVTKSSDSANPTTASSGGNGDGAADPEFVRQRRQKFLDKLEKK